MGEDSRSSRLDAELARLLEDPESIGYRPVRTRLGRTARPSRRRRVATPRSAPRRAVGLPSPVFVCLVAFTTGGGALAAMRPLGSLAAGVGVFVFILAGWLVSVCLHEFAHAYVAYRGGDHSIIDAEYLRLNPFRYVHPLLSVVLPLVWIALGGIGLPGGAVLVHRHQLRSKAWASAVSAAGPAVNILVGLIAIAFLHLFDGPTPAGGHGYALRAAIGWFAWLQVSVAILNLLPIPALDGWGIIEPWLSPTAARAADKIKPFGFLILVALLWTPSISAGFSELVSTLASWLGDPVALPWLGAQLFKFWRH